MSQFTDRHHQTEGCRNVGSLNYALRCIHGKLRSAHYGDSDITCSLDPVRVYQSDRYSCGLSYIDYKSYFSADCSGNLGTSDWRDDDDWDGSGDHWDGSENFVGISWNNNNGGHSNDGCSYMRCLN